MIISKQQMVVKHYKKLLTKDDQTTKILKNWNFEKNDM
jgi:hypothetical protein